MSTRTRLAAIAAIVLTATIGFGSAALASTGTPVNAVDDTVTVVAGTSRPVPVLNNDTWDPAYSASVSVCAACSTPMGWSAVPSADGQQITVSTASYATSFVFAYDLTVNGVSARAYVYVTVNSGTTGDPRCPGPQCPTNTGPTLTGATVRCADSVFVDRWIPGRGRVMLHGHRYHAGHVTLIKKGFERSRYCGTGYTGDPDFRDALSTQTATRLLRALVGAKSKGTRPGTYKMQTAAYYVMCPETTIGVSPANCVHRTIALTSTATVTINRRGATHWSNSYNGVADGGWSRLAAILGG